MGSSRWPAIAVVSALTLAGMAATARPLDTARFPSFEAIEGNVGFWKKVYGRWSLGQIAVHDLEYPALVYEVVDLPGPLEERYTEEQREFADDLVERWQGFLRELERKIAGKHALDDDEKRLALRIASTAGSDALVGAADRVRTQRGLRERFRRGIEIGGRYDATIRTIFRDHGLPEDLSYLPHVESSYQAEARSSAGALGVWQFTRGTGKSYLKINSAIDERLDPILAADGAARYLRDAYDRLGDWPLALTAYNHGINGMAKAAARHGADYEAVFKNYRGRLFGFASKNFYAEFLAAREVASDPQTHFPEGVRLEAPLDLDSRVLQRRASPDSVARSYGLDVDDLARLNPAWSRRAVRSGLALPAGSTIWLPKGTLQATAPTRDLGSDEYRVRPGDTLSSIAAASGVRISALRTWNGIPADSSLIRVGQRLRLREPAAAAEQSYVVRRGDTLSAIAARHGLGLDELRRLNGMSPRQSLIRAGDRLRVAAAASDAEPVHVVAPGETLMRIALRYGVRLADLLLTNRLSEHSIIHPGQQIRIP